MAMEVKREQHGEAVLLAVSGTVDIYSSPELRGELKTALQKKTPRVVVDLAEVGFIDSSGLATLIEALQKVTAYKGRLVLCGLGPQVRNVFQLANLDGIFQIRGTREEALA